jgi:hypothetical protein
VTPAALRRGLLQQQRDIMRKHFIHLVHHVLVQPLKIADVLDFAKHLAVHVHVGKVSDGEIVAPRACDELAIQPV